MVGILLLAYSVVTVLLAKSIVLPKTLSLEEERAWIAEHNLQGNYDTYQKEDYQIVLQDGYTIHATLVKAEELNSQKYVIISHGFRSNRNGNIKYTDVYHSLGYHVISYDVRGHGQNAKTKVSLGNQESADLLTIIEDAYQRFGVNIELGLHGESMGSAISLSVLAKTQNLRFVVADCGFSNLYDLIYGAYKENHIAFLMPGVYFANKFINGIDMQKTSPIDALTNNTVPVLFIHGAEDTFIRSFHSERIAEQNPSFDRLQLVPNAGHAQSREVLGIASYTAFIKDFLENIQ